MSETPIIIIDERERKSNVPELLAKKGNLVKFKQLNVGDYVISDRIAIERKTLKDFVKSIYEGRIFEQLSRLVEAYEMPIIIVEGDLNDVIFYLENLNIFRGALVSLIINTNVKLLYSLNENETADYISIIARREMKRSKEIFTPIIKGKKRIENIKDWQSYILQSFPYIGPKSAKILLREFKTLKDVFNADERKLSSLIGKEKARKIIEILNKKWEENSKITFK